MRILCIIPAFNAESFIVPVIQAILNQSYSNIHIVVVDDCSTDNTAALAKSLGVQVLSNSLNVGPYACLNSILNVSIGFDAWYFHGADDISFDNHFLSLAKPLIADDNIMMSYCNYNRVNYDSGASKPFAGNRTSMCLYRLSVFNTIGPYDDTRFGGDTEFWDRFLIYFPQSSIYHVNEYLANCMVHKHNLTKVFSHEQRRNYVSQFKARHQLLISSKS